MQVMMSILELEAYLLMYSMVSLSSSTPQSKIIHQLNTCKSDKPLTLMALIPTEANLLYHILRAHFQTILGKAAGQTSPPNINIADFG